MELISLNLRLKNWFGCKFTIHPFAGKRSDIRSADRWERANPVEQGAPPLLSSFTGWEAFLWNSSVSTIDLSFFCLFKYLFTSCQIRYQETPHTNPSWPAWSQPPEDVDLWEVLQWGKTVPLPWDTWQPHCMQVTNLLGKKKVYVYYINKLSQLRVYLDRTQVSTSIHSSSIDLIYLCINLKYLTISSIYQSHLSINLTYVSISYI